MASAHGPAKSISRATETFCFFTVTKICFPGVATTKLFNVFDATDPTSAESYLLTNIWPGIRCASQTAV